MEHVGRKSKDIGINYSYNILRNYLNYQQTIYTIILATIACLFSQKECLN